MDFIQLREKYLDKLAVSESKNVSTCGKKIPGEVLSDINHMETLQKYSICNQCQGQGILKEIYNHMVLQKDCPECDGAAIITKEISSANLR